MTDQLMFLLIVGTAVWVGFDAQELEMRRGRLGGGPIDMGTRAWVVCCLFLWVISFPCYLVARSKYVALRDAPPMPAADPVSPFAAAPSRFAVHASPLAVEPAVVPAATIPVQTAPPQMSPDGHWWWNGSEWVAAAAAGLSRG